MDTKVLAKNLREVTKTGKFILGYKAVSASVKGSKIILCSSSLNQDHLSNIQEMCKASGVPMSRIETNSLGLAKLIGKPFRVSALSIKNQGDADLAVIIESTKSSEGKDS